MIEPRQARLDDHPWPIGGGEMGERLRMFDWATTPLGPIAGWPQSLKTAVELMLASGFASAIHHGPAAILLYNDAWAELIGPHHPAALGRSSLTTFAKSRAVFEPFLQRAWDGETVTLVEQYFPLPRADGTQRSWFSLTSVPLRDERGQIVGVMVTAIETTRRVLAERRRDEVEAALRASEARQAFLLRLSDALWPLADPLAIQDEATRLLGEHLGLNRASYGEIEGESITFRRGYVHGVASLDGQRPFRPSGTGISEALQRGDTVVVHDITTDARFTATERARFQADDIIAFVGVMIVKEGRMVSVFGAQQATPRVWTADELALIREVAERVWSAGERARVEVALASSEASYRALAELSPDPILVNVDGRCVYANAAAARLLEVTDARELVGHAPFEFIAPEYHDRVRERLRAIMEGNSVVPRMVYQWRRRDGSPVDVEVIAGPIVWQGTPAAQVLAQDITERLAREVALVAGEERLRLALAAARAGAWEYDPAIDRIVCSPELYALYGLAPSPSTAAPAVFRERVHPADRAAVDADRQAAIERGGPFQVEFRVVGPDGATRWLSSMGVVEHDATGRLVRARGINQDITARKVAEERLERLRALTAALADTLTVEQVTAVILDHALPAVDAQAGILGRPVDGGTWLEIVGWVGYAVESIPADRRVALGPGLAAEAVTHSGQPVFIESLATIRAVYPASVRMLERAGLVAYAGLPVVTSQGFWGVLGLGFTTEQPFPPAQRALLTTIAQQCAQALERARLVAAIEAEQAARARLEERERIALELHDGIIQALYAIELTLGAASLTLGPDPARTEHLLQRASGQVTTVIEDIRHYIHDLWPSRLTEQDLAAGLRRLADDVWLQTLVRPTVECDEAALRHLTPAVIPAVLQVAREALSNVRRHAAASQVAVRLTLADDHLVLTIHDNGRGFDPARAGAGLGLRTLDERAAKLGGHVSITSAPGQGTTVRLVLPPAGTADGV